MLNLIWFLLIGAAAGWIARRIMNRPELNLVANMVLGMIGAIVGGFALGLVGLYPQNLIGALIAATLGAVALIWIAGRMRAAD
jgi:uncharacterized membrane protein YeaQ/YmgE (transglycosylase-associated protein family)